MASPRFAWGIDVGNRALKAIKLVRDGEKLRVADLEVIEHEQILSNAGDNRESLIQTALANFVQRHKLKGGVVGISVSGQSSFARFIKLPPVEPKKIPDIVRFEAIQQIPFPLDDVEWSYQLFQEKDSPDVEVGIFAMRKDLVNQQIKRFTDVEMNVQVVQMGPLAVYNAMAYDNRLSETTMIVDLGAENTDLIIAEGQTVWLRTIPIGGNNFTDVLAKQFKLNAAKAEELKRNARTSKYARQIFQAMRPIFADLVAEIQRSLGFYASVHRESRIKRIIALGATFRLPTLMKYLQQNLQIEVEQIDGFASGAPADGRLATVLSENLISMTSAYGLAIQAMGNARITSTLLPESIRRAKIWQDKNKWFAAAAAIIILGSAGAVGRVCLDRHNFEANQNVRQPLDNDVKTAEGLDRDWAALSNAGGPDRQVIHEITDMTTYLDLWPRIVAEIRSALPPIPATAKELMTNYPSRDKRPQVNIIDWKSNFDPHLGEKVENLDNTAFGALADAASVGGGQYNHMRVGASGPPTAKGNEDRGFLVTLHGTTPNSGGAGYLQSAVVSKLAALNQPTAFKAGLPFYFHRVLLVQVQTANQAAAKPGGPMAFRGPGNPVAAGGNLNLDPSTGESTEDDTDFKILIAVYLDPKASPATPPPGPGKPKVH